MDLGLNIIYIQNKRLHFTYQFLHSESVLAVHSNIVSGLMSRGIILSPASSVVSIAWTLLMEATRLLFDYLNGAALDIVF